MKIIIINAIWCPACIILNKTMKKIEADYPDLEYLSYDYDLDEEEIKKYEVGRRLPVLIVYKDDQEIKRLIGESSYEEISKLIEENI